VSQYATDANLALRQRLWATARREPEAFDLMGWVLDLCELDGGERILDVGCGNGAYERALSNRGHRGPVVAVDLSPGMAPPVVADVQTLPFATGRFDVVLAPHMLYHVPDIPAAARELRRVLRPGGLLVAVTNGEASLSELQRLVEDAVGTGWRMAKPATARFSLENGRRSLAAGFDDIDLVEVPPARLLVDDADVVAGYVASVPEYAEVAGVDWDTVVARVRSAVAAIIDADGVLSLSTATGAFLCR
jgi:SAM-dependent methyltransferase